MSTEPETVLLLGGEDGMADTVRPRLEAAGADLERVRVVTTRVVDAKTGEVRPLGFPTDAALLAAEIRRTEATFVVIDPLSCFLDDTIKANSDHQMRRAIMPLADIAEATGATIVIVRHLNKDRRNTKAVYRGGGSIGIIGAARVGLLAGVDPEDEDARVLAVTKNNLVPNEEKRAMRYRIVPDMIQGADGEEIRVGSVTWEGECDLRADELLAASTLDPGTARAEAETFLRNSLAQAVDEASAIPVADLKDEAEKQGVPWWNVRKAHRDLKGKSKKMGFRGAWVWWLPK